MTIVPPNVHYRIGADNASAQVNADVQALLDGLAMLGATRPALAWCVAGLHVDDPSWSFRCMGAAREVIVTTCETCHPAVRDDVITWWLDWFPGTLIGSAVTS